MATTGTLQLILDDLDAIKSTLTGLNKGELATLGSALVDLTEAARSAYRGTNVAKPQIAMSNQRYACTVCDRTWVGAEQVLVSAPKKFQLCGLCAQARNEPSLAERASGGLPPARPEDGWVSESEVVADRLAEIVADRRDVAQEIAHRGVVDGTYTVEFGSDWRTIRIETQPLDATFAPGKTVASYLNGPDNYRNYKGFAFVRQDGSFSTWKSFRGDGLIQQALHVVLSGNQGMVNGLKAYGRMSGHCGICRRQLTTPESLSLGIGPVCAAGLGL